MRIKTITQYVISETNQNSYTTPMSVYSLDDYGRMIADRVRMDAYALALKSVVKPDSVVLDIGAATGIHALLACKFGAKKVYAIEPNDAVHLAQEIAQANGFADRIEFIHDFSTDVTLPQQADIIVSDLRGVLPLFSEHIPTILDARQRHLAPGGLLIPQKDTLWAAVVETRVVYNEIIRPWDYPYGLNMNAAKQVMLNRWVHDDTETIRALNLLVKPQVWAILDYASIENPNVGNSPLVLEVTREGTAHGVLIWFDAQLADGVSFSNSPYTKKVAEVYGRGFFPFLEPVSVAQGDSITLQIQADLVDEEYEWQWHTRIVAQSKTTALKAEFKQSTTYD